jgi:tRNA(fMet)-specific endonuclease VapC
MKTPTRRGDSRQAGGPCTPIGAYDILIAGQARARGLTLVTRNLREFERIPGLSSENWQDRLPD